MVLHLRILKIEAGLGIGYAKSRTLCQFFMYPMQGLALALVDQQQQHIYVLQSVSHFNCRDISTHQLYIHQITIALSDKVNILFFSTPKKKILDIQHVNYSWKWWFSVYLRCYTMEICVLASLSNLGSHISLHFTMQGLSHSLLCPTYITVLPYFIVLYLRTLSLSLSLINW